jgi:hypothetical protein
VAGEVATAVAAAPSGAARQKTYKWKPGSRFGGGQAAAQAAGELIVRLARRHTLATPEIIVAAAKPASSPIHAHFTWNNSAAAQKCRLLEASKLLRSIVTIEIIAGRPMEFRAVVTGQVQGTDEAAGYMELETALSDPAMRPLVMARAEAEMDTFIAKYSRFRRFDAVIAAMRACLGRKKRRKKPGK